MIGRMTLAVALLAALVLPSSAAAESRAERPNVVVIMTDDQDFRSMPVMPKTRRLIGREGVTFDRNFVNYPLCCPSRATFLTGQYGVGPRTSFAVLSIVSVLSLRVTPWAETASIIMTIANTNRVIDFI